MPQLKAEYWCEEKNALIVLKWAKLTFTEFGNLN